MKTTVEKIAARIKRSNEQFLAASPEEQRVTIAKDVISWLNVGKLRARTGMIIDFQRVSSDYVRKPGNEKSYTDAHVNRFSGVQNVLFEENEVSCRVCAKGAMFLGVIGRVNEMKVCEISGTSIRHDTTEMRKLGEFFSETQISLIEIAFEGTQYMYKDFSGNTLKFNGDDKLNAMEYLLLYPDPTKRLKVICRNIINNNGTFIP